MFHHQEMTKIKMQKWFLSIFTACILLSKSINFDHREVYASEKNIQKRVRLFHPVREFIAFIGFIDVHYLKRNSHYLQMKREP
jgi:hypothetical protein